MPKTIAITPSWYWPESVDRVAGIPPFAVHELCVLRHVRDKADQPALIGETTVSFGELAERLQSEAPAQSHLMLSGELSIDSIVSLLAALAVGCQTTLVENGAAEAAPAGTAVAGATGQVLDLTAPVLYIEGKDGVAAHSHRSLVAGAISMATFLGPDPERSWLLGRPLNTWEGLLSLLLPLYLGAPVAIQTDADMDGFVAAISQHQPGYLLTDLTVAATATREAKRAVRGSRDVLAAMLLSTPGVFEPGDRQRVGKSFRCPALTVFGLAETGAIFCAHPQWYVDESIGIPITNAHVVPADPRDSSPIQTLWELVESAEVTVKGPSLMTGYKERNDTSYLVDGRFRTGVIASSDANGMIYILPD